MRRRIALAATVLVLATAAPAFADVANRSGHRIFLKPERGSGAPIEVGPGETYRGQQDGIMDPALPAGKVFKVVDGVDAVVYDDGEIATHATDPVSGLGQRLFGGEIDPPDPGWVDFDRVARQAAAKDPACQAAARRAAAKRALELVWLSP